MNDPSQGGQNKRVGFVSTRIAGTDGVSLEIAKWATELAREDVCYFDLQDTPSQIATKMLSFAAGKPHRYFRRTKSSHLWDSIYRTGLVPLFQEVLEEQEAKVTVHA